MARYSSSEPLYEAANKFKNQCLLSDNSLLWPDKKAWSLEVLQDLQYRMVDTAIEGSDQSFLDKLSQQMKGASEEAVMVMADIFFIYSLPAVNIKPSTKKGWIKSLADTHNLSLPDNNDPLWNALTAGSIHVGQKYNRKYEQFVLIIMFGQYLKQERDIIWEHHNIRMILDRANEFVNSITVTASDLRSMLLHMFFPDYYEDIISDRDKEKIYAAFKGKIPGEIPEEIDDAILAIRKVFSKELDKDNVPFQFYKDLGHLWKTQKITGGQGTGKRGNVSEKKERYEGSDLSRILTVLKYTKNIVLYGPPGTGKTYTAKIVGEKLITDQLKKKVSPVMQIQEIVEALPMYELIALALFSVDGKKFLSAAEIEHHEIIAARYTTRPVKSKREVIWGTLQSHTDPTLPNVHVSRSSEPYLFQKDDESKWGLTEIGRQYIQENLEQELSLLNMNVQGKNVDPGKFIYWSAFHQNYSYEEFIEGLRPKSSEDNPGEIVYDVELGAFRKICVLAGSDPTNKYILIIDEINRGNISKIFGELISLIEDDKRLGSKNQLTVNLPYNGDIFGVPSNLYVIGTMNTSDRSIALLDVALRRRFAFIEMIPQANLLLDIDIEVEGAQVNIAALLNYLNERISIDIDRNHQIGHSYFLEMKDIQDQERIDVLEYIWNYKIIPLLEEYYYNQYDKLLDLLFPFKSDKPAVSNNELDETPLVEISRQSGDDLIFALQTMLAENDHQ